MVETASDHFEYLSIRAFQKQCDMHNGICRKGSEDGDQEEASSCVFDSAQCLLDLVSSSSARKAEKITSLLCREGSVWRTFAEHVLSMGDCHEIRYSTWKQCLMQAEFGRDLINFGQGRFV